MPSSAVLIPPTTSIPASAAAFPADVEVMKGILDFYGFDFFFRRTLRMFNLTDSDYGDAVDEALSQYHNEDLNAFSLVRAFSVIVADLKEGEDFTYEEALEFLSEEDYVVPVTTAMAYSVDAGETDIEYLSKLVRNRAKRLLKQLRRPRS